MILQKNKTYLPAIIWLLVITVLSGYPGNHVPKIPVWQFDKLVHTVIYFVLSVTLIYAFQKQYNQVSKRIIISISIILFGIFYGGFMEIMQHYIFINRSGNWYDFIANGVGAILGVFIFPLVMKLLPIKK